MSDIDEETEWFLAAADEDMLAFETEFAGIHFEPTAIRSAVFEVTHSMTISRLNMLDVIIEWDRVDAHLTDGARTPSAWLRSRLALSHGHAVAMLKQARGLRNTPQLRLALLQGALSFDQADQTAPPPPNRSRPQICEAPLNNAPTRSPSSRSSSSTTTRTSTPTAGRSAGLT